MFKKQEIQRLTPLLLFWAGYTALFLLWAATFWYTFPFLLGLLIAVISQPAIGFLEKKSAWSHKLCAALITAAVLLLLCGLLTFLGVWAVREVTALVVQLTREGFPQSSPLIASLLDSLGRIFQKFDLSLWEQNQEEILALLKSSMDLLASVLKTFLGIVTSLPTLALMVAVVIFSAFFFAGNMQSLRSWVKGILTAGAVFHVKSAAENSGSMGRKYLASYLFLYFITFCEAVVILSILGISYPLTTALFTAVADVLPVLGPGFVFLPMAVYHLLTGEYQTALGLLLGWGILSLIRQILEPKLVSATVKVHPLGMLAAIYFSLVGKSLWILLYAAGLCSLHAVFRETGALPSLTQRPSPPAET